MSPAVTQPWPHLMRHRRRAIRFLRQGSRFIALDGVGTCIELRERGNDSVVIWKAGD
jgi:hypothetical protein